MHQYRTVFGRYSRLTATFENGVYRWHVAVRGQDLPEFTSAAIPDEKELLLYFLQRLPRKLQGASRNELRVLPKKIRESIKYLENNTSK